jgi:hypothetical protein
MLATIHSSTFYYCCLLFKHAKIKMYETMLVVLYTSMCEIWSLTLKEEHKAVFENRVLKRIFGLK